MTITANKPLLKVATVIALVVAANAAFAQPFPTKPPAYDRQGFAVDVGNRKIRGVRNARSVPAENHRTQCRYALIRAVAKRPQMA